jgi:ElaB/YqjD/DUF883 family membrane-anchored ribosome-binding protein
MSAKLNVDIVAQLKDFNKAMTELKSEVGDLNKQVSKGNNDSIKSTNALSGAFSSVGKTLAGLFAADMLINFGKAVIETTAEFQKMEAVLTNTLGSSSMAQQSMAQIVEFASKTPFQVNELTESFVKLANRGFKPTMEEMTALGDVASSTGKSFDQLTEAALDAMTGEFERLKEFGIRAASEGDRVQFTFKGVTTEVKKTDESIKNYLISLGQAEGVSGSMAAISETVGGKISNLGDNIDQLQLAIGNQTSGVFAATVDWLSAFVMHAGLSIKSIGELKKEVNDLNFSSNVTEIAKEVDFLITKYKSIYPELSNTALIDKAINQVSESYKGLSKTSLQNGTITVGQLWAIQDELDNYSLKLKETAAKASVLTKDEIEEIKKKAEAQKKAHEQRIKQLRTESVEFQQHVRDTYKLVVRDPFGGPAPDSNRNADVERQQIMANAGAKVLAINKQIALTMPGIIIPEDAVARLQAYNAAQAQLGAETALVAKNMGAALFVGDMFGQVLSGLGETGKVSFQGIFDALKQMVIRFAAAIAAAFTLNILTGGLVMQAGGGGKGLGALIKGGKSFGIGGLTPFAAGGIVSGPTAALVGEYSGAKTNPEVIAPLSKLQNMMGGNVTFTISGDSLVGTLNRANKTRARKF